MVPAIVSLLAVTAGSWVCVAVALSVDAQSVVPKGRTFGRDVLSV